jgi:nitrite reductase (NADH) large subunit
MLASPGRNGFTSGVIVNSRYRCTVCGYIHEGDGPPDECPVCGAAREEFVREDNEAPAPGPAAPPVAATESAPAAGPRWVILGGGIAGLSAVEAARELNPDALITLVHREAELPYNRLNLTRYLAGAVDRSALAIRPGSWFGERRIRLVRAEARHLDCALRRLVLDDGGTVFYDRLVLATGAHAFVPAVPGVRRRGVHVLRTVADADAILEGARRGARCVCVGGGLLGIETAGGLAMRGLEVTILDQASGLLPRQLARSAADRLAALLGGLGIAIRTGVTTAEITGDESVRAVVLTDGAEVPADLVVIAAGVRPNAGLARSAGLAVNRAVVVDDSLRASDPNVFAAGDVAEHRGISSGLWTVAMEQGQLAGRALAGGDAVFRGTPPATQLKVLAWTVFSIGRFEPDAPGDTVLEQADTERLVRVVLRNDVPIGANVVGDASLAGPLRRAVQEQRALAAVPGLGSIAWRSPCRP